MRRGYSDAATPSFGRVVARLPRPSPPRSPSLTIIFASSYHNPTRTGLLQPGGQRQSAVVANQ